MPRRTQTTSLPTRNPWLADSVYPTSHVNPGATDSVLIAGPTESQKLTKDDVKTVPTPFTSNPAVKRIGTDTVAFGSGALGIQKILLTGHAFDPIALLPYPGFEQMSEKAAPLTIQSVLADMNAASRKKDEKAVLAAVSTMDRMGVNMETGINGVYNLFDRDGYHYCVYGGTRVLKSTDDNQVRAPIRVVKSVDVAAAIPAEAAQKVTRIIGLGMTYDGYLAAAAPGAVVILDRDLTVKAYTTFSSEVVDNSIAIDEKNGIYVVTSKRMLKLVWTGARLSTEERDGAWSSEYDSMPGEEAMARGAISRGSGTTPTLMGFNDDPDKLVVIVDASASGANLVAFWRDAIPEGFTQKPGTKSRRIADQTRIEITELTVEPSPNVLGYGVAVLNSTYPKPTQPPGVPNGFTAGVTRPAPMGIEKFEWDTTRKAFKKAWINLAIDNSDIMVPVVSAATGLMYAAHKVNGDYQYVGLDWETGEIKTRLEFPDDSRAWNAFGGITTVLEDGDLMIGGMFATKRVIASHAHA